MFFCFRIYTFLFLCLFLLKLLQIFFTMEAPNKLQTENDILARLNNVAAQLSKGVKESVHNYSLYYALIQAGIMQRFVNLNSYNTLYSDIKNMTEKEYINLKSTFDAKKKLRRYFQNFGINKFKTEIERINALNAFLADMSALLIFENKKAEKENKK